MSGKYTQGGMKPGGGDGRETRDAQDDAAIRTYLGEIRDLIAGQSNALSVGSLAAQDHERYSPPGSFYQGAAASPGGEPAPMPTAADAAGLATPPQQPRPGDEAPFGPEGPNLRHNFQPSTPEPNPAKTPDARRDDGGDPKAQGKPGPDYTSRLDEIIRLLGKANATSGSAVAVAQAAATASGQSSDSVTTDDGSGNVTTRTTKAPGLPSPGWFAHPIGRSDYGPGFDYGTRAYPWTNVAGGFESVGRFAASNVPGLRNVSGAFVQSAIDFDAIKRPFRDFDPYSILKGRNALNEDIEAARADLDSHRNKQLPANATDQEKAEHQDSLKKKQSVLDALEAHKDARSASARWAESVTEQMSGTAVGKLAAKVGKSLGGGEELGVAGAISGVSKFAGTALGGAVAIVQFEKAVAQWAAGGRADGLQQVASLRQYGMAAPIAGELARFGVARMMRDIAVGYDTAESSQRLIRYGAEVEMRSRAAMAGDVRMGNAYATFRFAMGDRFNEIRDPFDELFRRTFDNPGGDAFLKQAGGALTSVLLGPLSVFSDILKRLGVKSDGKPIKDNPLTEFLKLGETIPTYAPPIPDIP